MTFLNDEWLSMDKEAAYRKILGYTNKDQSGSNRIDYQQYLLGGEGGVKATGTNG